MSSKKVVTVRTSYSTPVSNIKFADVSGGQFNEFKSHDSTTLAEIEGESPKLKILIKKLQKSTITLYEYILLIGKFSGDPESVTPLMDIATDEINNFIKLGDEVFKSLTDQIDVVLMNVYKQSKYKDKENHKFLQRKIAYYLDIIYQCIPGFSFEKYTSHRNKYLNRKLPIPDDIDLEPEELEMLKRQKMFHRLQWLRSEGERLKEENDKLTEKLCEVKKVYMEEQSKAATIEDAIIKQREYLVETEVSQKEKLEQINESLEKAILREERTLRREGDKVQLKKKSSTKSKSSVDRKSPSWAVKTAKELERKSIEKSIETSLGQTGDRRTQYVRSGEERFSKSAPKKKPEYILIEPEKPPEPPNILQTQRISTRRTEDKENANSTKNKTAEDKSKKN